MKLRRHRRNLVRFLSSPSERRRRLRGKKAIAFTQITKDLLADMCRGIEPDLPSQWAAATIDVWHAQHMARQPLRRLLQPGCK